MRPLISSSVYLILMAAALIALCIGMMWVISVLIPGEVIVSPAWPMLMPFAGAVLAMRRPKKLSHALHLVRFVLVVSPFLAVALLMRPADFELVVWASLIASGAAVLFCIGYVREFLDFQKSVRLAGNMPKWKREQNS